MIRAGILGLALALAGSGLVRADDLVNDADRDFVGVVNQQCLFASHLAGAASNQASSPAIKAHADKAVARHLAICVELKRLADKWQIGTPGTLEHAFSEAYDRTVGLSGSAFDDAYRAAMAKADAAQSAAVTAEIQQGLNPDLRTFATGQLTSELRTDQVPAAGTP